MSLYCLSVHNDTVRTPLFTVLFILNGQTRHRSPHSRTHPYTPLPVHTPWVHRCTMPMPAGSPGTPPRCAEKSRSRHDKRLRFVMAGQASKQHRLIYVRARCIYTEKSYHQRLDQLRKPRLCSFLTVYSATETPGSSVTAMRER